MPPRRGMTLIELLVGLVVLGTVLASVTIARGRFLQQWRQAETRLQVTRATDALLARWMSGPLERIPVAAQGRLTEKGQHVWRTSPRRDAAVEALGAVVVRLEVYERQPEMASASRAPVVTVEFLVPRAEEEAPR